MQRQKTPLYSVNSLSKLTGRDRRTLEKVLVHVEPAGKRAGRPVYDLAIVQAALRKSRSTSEELLLERLEALRLENARKRREEAEAAGELVRRDEYEALLAKTLLPYKQRLDSLAPEMCSQTNPTDPRFAHAALLRWSEEAKRMILAAMPQIADGKPDDEVRVLQPAG